MYCYEPNAKVSSIVNANVVFCNDSGGQLVHVMKLQPVGQTGLARVLQLLYACPRRELGTLGSVPVSGVPKLAGLTCRLFVGRSAKKQVQHKVTE